MPSRSPPRGAGTGAGSGSVPRATWQRRRQQWGHLEAPAGGSPSSWWQPTQPLWCWCWVQESFQASGRWCWVPPGRSSRARWRCAGGSSACLQHQGAAPRLVLQCWAVGDVPSTKIPRFQLLLNLCLVSSPHIAPIRARAAPALPLAAVQTWCSARGSSTCCSRGQLLGAAPNAGTAHGPRQLPASSRGSVSGEEWWFWGFLL